jgi:hypothetical protein
MKESNSKKNTMEYLKCLLDLGLIDFAFVFFIYPLSNFWKK